MTNLFFFIIKVTAKFLYIYYTYIPGNYPTVGRLSNLTSNFKGLILKSLHNFPYVEIKQFYTELLKFCFKSDSKK